MRRIVYICTGSAILAAVILAVGLKPLSPEPFIVPPVDLTVRILFTGDMMFDRGVARHADQYGVDSLTRGIQSLLHGDPASPNDAVIGNLEGTITTQPSITQTNNKILHFTFDPKYAAVVRDAGFTAVSLANNHAMDFYHAGYESTGAFLDAAGVKHFGSPYNDEQQSVSLALKGKRVCIVGYHDLYTLDETSTIAEIIRIRPKCDFLAVFPHWGIEYKLSPSDRQRSLAHEFIDAGADLVIGAHPHVVAPVEIYRGKAIFYSLGNLIFDQGLSFWTEHGLAVQVTLHQNGQTDFRLVPTVLNKAEAGIATSTDRAQILRTVDVDSGGFSLKK